MFKRTFFEFEMSVPKSWKTTSEYFNGLTPNDKAHYTKKLTLNNDEILPDPYSIKEGWSDDVGLLPDVAYPDIYTYLIETPSEFTKDKLKAYKSLEAYNIFVSRNVQEVFICEIKSKSFQCIKSEVLPSQRQGDRTEMYKVWIIIHTKGWILTANCTCMAG